MPEHETTVTTFSNGVRWNCTCGAMGRWDVADGSAQQEAYAHKIRADRYVEAQRAQDEADEVDERDSLVTTLRNELGWDWPAVPDEHIPSADEVIGDLADAVITRGFHLTSIEKVAPVAYEVRDKVNGSKFVVYPGSTSFWDSMPHKYIVTPLYRHPAAPREAGFEVTDEMIEAAAKELFEEDANVADVEWPEWDSEDNIGKPIYLDNARAALTAAFKEMGKSNG